MISVGPCSCARSASVGQRGERAGHHALGRRGAVLDDGRRQVGTLAMLDQFRAQDRQAEQSHVDDDGLPRPRERRPVEVHAAVLEVAGDEQAGLRMLAMRERDAGECRDAERCGDARHDLERDAVRGERVDFLAAAPEHERVTAFQAQHASARPRVARRGGR